MIVDQLFNPKPLEEGGPYDLPGKDYDRPGDTPRKPRPQGGTTPRRHPDDPDFMDPDQRRLRADQARVAKANAEYQAKKKKPVNEAMLMEDPIYRDFKRVGRYIAEQKLTEPEILQIFADAETGMTDKATGANRTFVGRGKDATVDFAKDVAGALKGVWSGIQDSVPVQAVDTAWDQATDAMANLTGGQKGAVMTAINKYRNLAKQYPKTAGLAKAALVGITGLVTGGAGLPAVAALVYGLDSAIKGEKFSDIALKAGGAAATAWAAGKLFGSDPNAFDPGSGTGWDASQTPGGPADTNALTNVNQMGDYNGDYVNMPDGSDTVTSPLVAPPPELATYTVQPGDKLSVIADRFNTSVAELKGLNPQLAAASGATGGQGMNVDVIFPGQQITLPPGTPGMDVYAGGVGTNANTMADIASGQVPDSAITQGMAAKGQAAADAVSGRADNLANMAQQAGSAPIDYSQTGPISTDSLGHKLEYGIPVTDTGNFVPPNPGLPADELAKQTAAYNSWKADFMKRNPNTYINADGNQMQIMTKPTLPAAVQESIKFKIIPASKLIDQKATVLSWALNESVGRRSKSVNLTTIGTYTVFENVDRYRQALLEYTSTQPGRPELPDQYAPAMSGGAGVKSEPGMIGRGLNWLDRGVKKVGGALSNFGHQFTTNVTKEKLKMNWHQAGKPSDSDQLAAWLVKQGVPQEVVTSVFGKMGIPYTSPAAQATAQPTAQPAGQTAAPAKTGGAQKEMPQYGTNPATGKIWTYDELVAPETGLTPADIAPPAATDAAKPAPAASKFPGEDPQGPGYVGRREVARRQAARDAEAAKKPARPNFAQQGGGYKSVNYAPNIKTGINLPKPAAAAKPASTSTASKGGLDQAMIGKAKPGSLDAQIVQNLQAPGKATINTGGPNPNAKQKLATTDADMDAAEKAQLAKMTAKNPNLARLMATNPEATTETRIATALKKPVAEMLQMVETKEDVQKIKQFIDQTFTRYGAVNESAFAVRNQILEHVTQEGAQRRREHSQRLAH